MLTKCIHDDINVCGDIVKRSGIIKLLGTLLDSNLNFKKHIISKSKTLCSTYKELSILGNI